MKVIKEPDLNKQDLKLGFFRIITSLDFKSVEETLKSEANIVGLMETGKI